MLECKKEPSCAKVDFDFLAVVSGIIETIRRGGNFDELYNY